MGSVCKGAVLYIYLFQLLVNGVRGPHGQIALILVGVAYAHEHAHAMILHHRAVESTVVKTLWSWMH